jgi:hypothetical protein
VPGEADLPTGAGPMPFGSAPSDFDVFTPRGHVRGAGETPGAADAGPRSGPAPATEPSAPFAGSGSYVASPPYPASGSSPYPDQPAPFPGWTLHHPPGASGGRTAPRPGAPAGPATPTTPVAPSRPGQASVPPWELPGEPGPLPAGPGGSGPGPDTAGPDDSAGLPRRVKQASLAPQLRASPPQRRTTVASVGPSSGTSGPSPAEIRRTMSALQRGWQEGRSQRMADPASGGPPRPPSAASAGPAAGTGSAATASPPPEADQDSYPGGAHDSSTDEQARGGSDGP